MFQFLDPLVIIKTLGLLGVFFIIFAESGLFFGFFLPGDSLLFTAGVLASQNYLPIWWLLPGCFLAAVLGDAVGYWFGRSAGKKFFSREDSFFFKKHHADRAKDFYERHGGRAIIMARFIPIVRTFAPIVAGVGEMSYKKFSFFNIIGGLIWSFGLVGLGFTLGRTVPSIDSYILPIIALIIFLSFLPGIFQLFARPKKDETINHV